MADLERTSLHDLHMKLGAKIVPFTGYEMPVQYPMGVMKEHIHTREQSGLFDVSHMGQIIIRSKSGSLEDAALALERLVPTDILGLGKDRQRYTFFTNSQGGIIDDLMVANRGDHLFLVINAACKHTDIEHMQSNLSDICYIDIIEDRALIALQGPASEKVLSELTDATAAMKFMDVVNTDILGVECWVSRSGYTGEDGYEISIPNANANEIANALLEFDAVEPIGLGARDSLRLEAGLCLYGNDIDAKTSPVEAGLTWAMQKIRRMDGEREGGFPGSETILQQIITGAPLKRVGLRPDGRAPMRNGTKLYRDESSSEVIGTITSGGFGPTINGPVSMGYLSSELANINQEIFAEVRGKRMSAQVVSLPFTRANFKR